MSSKSRLQAQAQLPPGPPDTTTTHTTTNTNTNTPPPPVIGPVEFNSPFTPGESFSGPVTRTIFVTTSPSPSLRSSESTGTSARPRPVSRARIFQQQQRQQRDMNTNTSSAVSRGMTSGDGVGVRDGNSGGCGFRTPQYHDHQGQQQGGDLGSNSNSNSTHPQTPPTTAATNPIFEPEPEPTVSFRLHCHPHYVRRTELPAQLRRLKRSWSVPEIYGVSDSFGSEVTGPGGEFRENNGQQGGISELMRYREIHDSLLHSTGTLVHGGGDGGGDEFGFEAVPSFPRDVNTNINLPQQQLILNNKREEETLAAIKLLLAGEARRWSTQSWAPAHGHQARNASLSGSGVWGWDNVHRGAVGEHQPQVDGSASDMSASAVGPTSSSSRRVSRASGVSIHSHPGAPKRGIPRRTSSSVNMPEEQYQPPQQQQQQQQHNTMPPAALNSKVIENYAHYVCSRRHNSIPSQKPRHIKIVFHNPNWAAGEFPYGGVGGTVYDGRDYDPTRRASQQKPELLQQKKEIEAALRAAYDEMEPLSPQISPTTVVKKRLRGDDVGTPIAAKDVVVGEKGGEVEGNGVKRPAAKNTFSSSAVSSMLPRRVQSSHLHVKNSKKSGGGRSASVSNGDIAAVTTSATATAGRGIPDIVLTGPSPQQAFATIVAGEVSPPPSPSPSPPATTENGMPTAWPRRAKSAPPRPAASAEQQRISAFTEDVYLGFEKTTTTPLPAGGMVQRSGGGLSGLRSPTGSLRRLGGKLGKLVVGSPLYGWRGGGRGLGGGENGAGGGGGGGEGSIVESLEYEGTGVSSVVAARPRPLSTSALPRFESLKTKEREKGKRELALLEPVMEKGGGIFRWFSRGGGHGRGHGSGHHGR
ncbi:hypothetical protein DFH27DRAFT_526966 [Peziza echinospora]|nr:hypothetical protein DFH27DRAFT_526966 [Peziza echinospora]